MIVIEISIAVHYVGYYETKILQRGSFPVNFRKYKENEKAEVTRVANGFIKEIKESIHVTRIEKVIYNGSQDITEWIDGSS